MSLTLPIVGSDGLSGQKCSACSRAIVVDAVHDELVERLGERAAAVRIGDPADPDVFTGPVVDERAAERFAAAVAEAGRDGTVVAGGGRPDLGGHFVEPSTCPPADAPHASAIRTTTASSSSAGDTVVAGLPHAHRLTSEELFVPFVTVTRVASLDEALAEANAIDDGLTAGDPRRGRGGAVPRRDRGGGRVRQPARRGDHRGLAGHPVLPGWKSSGSTGKGGLGP